MRVPGVGVTRRRSKFETWAWSPVIVLRIALVITYLLYVHASVIAFFAGIPLFSLTAPEGYTSIWACLLGIAATVSAVGSVSDRWSRVERWASLALSSLMLAYVGGLTIVAYISGDLARQFVAAIALIAFVLPVTRFVYLAAQSGKRQTNATG